MAKTIEDIKEELGINENTSLSDLLTMFANNTVVTQAEINNIKAISVLPLPNNSKDKAEELKKRFTNIVLDENKGLVHLMDVRSTLMSVIVNRISLETNPYDREVLRGIIQEIIEDLWPDYSEEAV